MSELVNVQLIKAGLLSSIQDLGDPSLMDRAVPIGGALDKYSAIQANLLVGNAADCPLLEITLYGPILEFDGACQIAICGADISPMLNGQSIPLNQALNIHAGDRLSFGKLNNGCRAYLAIGGDWLQSPRTNGIPNPPLRKGDLIQLTPSHREALDLRLETEPFKDKLELILFPGPEFEQFSRAYLAYFFGKEWKISPQSNRMGFRLMAGSCPDPGIHEIVSSGILPGTIQVSGSGQAVLLLADAQTTGGYPRLGIVASKQMDAIGQLKPGDQIRFVFTQIGQGASPQGLE
ncbi:MAG: biotin-dependent carboxyltransferase family protein [Bacteroidia bacterium]|nr:biotin-dependent carboxyltransferase family protein [Bacteroidia bacterium]